MKNDGSVPLPEETRPATTGQLLGDIAATLVQAVSVAAPHLTFEDGQYWKEHKTALIQATVMLLTGYQKPRLSSLLDAPEHIQAAVQRGIFCCGTKMSTVRYVENVFPGTDEVRYECTYCYHTENRIYCHRWK